MEKLTTRAELLKLVPKGGVMVEVGVFRGEFSQMILDECQPKKFYMVDIWDGMEMSGDKDGKNIVRVNDMKRVYENEILPVFGVRPEVSVVKTTASDFFRHVAIENSFDAIYIDALHTYRAVAQDLENARRVVKPGGIIMGHDYAKKFPGVIRAVTEFCQRYHLQISYLTEDGCPSYYIVNNK
jgi:hypothetical protein